MLELIQVNEFAQTLNYFLNNNNIVIVQTNKLMKRKCIIDNRTVKFSYEMHVIIYGLKQSAG